MIRHTWLILAGALMLAPGARAGANPDEVVATEVRCGDFAGRSDQQQQRLIAFLQGYDKRSLGEAQVGEVEIGGIAPTLTSECARDPQATVWQKVHGSANMPDVSSPNPNDVPDAASGSTTQGQSGTPSGSGNRTTGATTRDGVTRAKPLEFTCGEFTRLQTNARPNILYWLDGYSRKNDDAPKVDLDRGEGPFDEACRVSKQQTVWSANRLKLSPQSEPRNP